MNRIDRWIASADTALRTVAGNAHSSRAYPASAASTPDGTLDGTLDHTLNVSQRRLSGALMRVNHVGEVCAQALYQAQALTARSEPLRRQMAQAAREETDHLAWTEQRLRELEDRASWLNPLWYAGAFGIGLVAGRIGDTASLGFVVETERQVEAHLASHLERLPAADRRSRAIVVQMKLDEQRHADVAEAAGARPLPIAVRGLMRVAAKVMTFTAHRI